MTQTEYEQFTTKVKETIKKQPIPPHYNPCEWKEFGINCYLYAMRACMDFSDKGSFGRPGCLARREENEFKYEKDYVIKNFKEDCRALSLKVSSSTLEEKTVEGEYKIAIYVDENYDFHFRRQDSNGQWSEVSGWYGRLGIVKTEDITKDDEDYKFSGIFKVSKSIE